MNEQLELCHLCYEYQSEYVDLQGASDIDSILRQHFPLQQVITITVHSMW